MSYGDVQDLVFVLTFNNDGGTQVVLTNEAHGSSVPDGYDDAQVKYERSKKYHGVFKNFSIPLKWVKGAAELIRTEWYTYGLKSDVGVSIQKLDRTSMEYFVQYEGELDFSTFKDYSGGDKPCVECAVISGGLHDLIKKNEDTEYVIADYLAPLGIATPDIQVYAMLLDHAGHNAMRVRIFLGQILEKITGSATLYKSDFLSDSSFETYYAILSGKSFRLNANWYDGFKTTLSDFFKSIDSVWCLGMGIETIEGVDKLVIEQRDYFYNEEIITTLGEVSNLTVSVSNDHNFGKAKGGYPEKDYKDEIIRNLEPNTEVSWKLPNATTTNEYDFQSKYRADYQGLKQIYDANAGSGGESDDSQDEDIFIVRILRYGLTSEYHLVSGGLKKSNDAGFYADLFNSFITPRNNLLNHQQFLSDCSFKLDGEDITFTSGKNEESINKVDVNGSSGYVTEAEPVEALPPYKFVPLSIEFEAPYPCNFAELIDANPHGLIRFTVGGEYMKGWILSVEPKLSEIASGKYKLLCHKDNDLTKFIK